MPPGLQILPGLVRYDEVASGHIDHALRLTVDRSQRGYILPATHFASSSSDPTLPLQLTGARHSAGAEDVRG